MVSRNEFARALAEQQELSHVDRAIALLYYYRETQEFEERTPGELAADLHDEGFPQPNITRLRNGLRASSYTTRGRQTGSFQIDVRFLADLEQKFEDVLGTRKIKVHGRLLPEDWVAGTRLYLERLVYQINGTYESGFYDACGTLCRRLMESLIIEIYIHEKRHHEIQKNGAYISLENLIKYVTNDGQVSLGRNTPKTMLEIKQLGDTAAHDRTYITPLVDVDDLKAKYRRMIQELLNKAGI